MAVYADYQFYSIKYLANEASAVIPTAESFLKYARNASQYINRYTFNRIPDTVLEEVQMCCCELAEALYNYDQLINRGVASESVGDVSVSYESSVTITQRTSQKIKEIIYNWLENTGYLYRGV